MATTRKVNASAIDKLVKDVQALPDTLDRIAAATFAIARLREAVSTLATERQATAAAAKAEGVPYAELARAAGMSTGRMAAIATGRGQYVRAADKSASSNGGKAAKAAPAKKAAAKGAARKASVKPSEARARVAAKRTSSRRK